METSQIHQYMFEPTLATKATEQTTIYGHVRAASVRWGCRGNFGYGALITS